MEFLSNLVSFVVVATICVAIGDFILFLLVKHKEKNKKKQENQVDSPASEDTKKEGVQ